MKRETELLKQYQLYIYHHANAFHAKAALPRHMLEDVCQEACVAFLLYLREVPDAEEALQQGRFMVPTSRIRFHLYRQFVDSAGIGLNAKTLRVFLQNHRLPFAIDGDQALTVLDRKEHEGSCEAFWLEDADTLKAVYMRDWLYSLSPQDRQIAILFMSGFNGREVAERTHISQKVANAHWLNCRKSYTDYVEVA